jgi:hypothetical protein
MLSMLLFRYGQSLGGGAATHLSAMREVGGAILHSTFTSGLRVIRSDVETTYGPASSSSRRKKCLIVIFMWSSFCHSHFFDIFPNVDTITAVSSPVFIMHGTHDNEIPIDHGIVCLEIIR